MRRPIVAILLAAPLFASCQGAGPEAVLSVTAAPEQPVASMATPMPAYVAPEYNGPKLPGRWGIYVDAANVPHTYGSTNATCGDRSYDIPADTVIRDAIMDMSGRAFDSVRALASPPARGRSGGATWAMLIRLTQADGGLTWENASARPVARADLKAEITVFDSRGQVVNSMTENASAMSDYGPGGCEGGEALMTHAYQRASQSLLGKITPEIGTN